MEEALFLQVMGDFVTEYTDYDSFARRWHSDTLDERDISLEEARDRGLLNEQDTRQLWQLLGLLEDDEVFVQIPEWLAEDKVGATNRATPTTFVGRIAQETEDAIRVTESAAAHTLMRLAHRIHTLEHGLENTAADEDRREWLQARIDDNRRKFDERKDIPELTDEWLPKSQLITVIQRSE